MNRKQIIYLIITILVTNIFSFIGISLINGIMFEHLDFYPLWFLYFTDFLILAVMNAGSILLYKQKMSEFE